jgi:hypothetical protein
VQRRDKPIDSRCHDVLRLPFLEKVHAYESQPRSHQSVLTNSPSPSMYDAW